MSQPTEHTMGTEVKDALEASELEQFTGTDHYYRHQLTGLHFTDGAKYLAERAGAYWLVNEILTLQPHRKIAAEPFQVWNLKVTGSEAVLTCDDGNENVVYTKRIEFTDFPLPEIKLFFQNGVLFLPSEY